MEEYPRTVLEFEDRFATEEACLRYLAGLRWPEGFVCPRCENQGGWPASRGRWICQKCRYQGSVTAGTIFQDTHKPLRMWFRAAWHVTSQKTGASAVSAGAGKLRHRVDLVAQVATGDGASWSRSLAGPSGSR
jgi:transposase-like protein